MISLVTGSNDPIALNAVMEVQRQLIEIHEENWVLREELPDLKNERIISAELEYREGVYKKGSEDNMMLVCDVCNKRRFSNIIIDELQSK